jgi:hypothetical protein
MSTIRRRIGAAAAAILLAAVLIIGLGAPASAGEYDDDARLQQQVTAILDDFPGGKQIAPGVISWDDGAAVLTLESKYSARSIGSCLTGRYCAWSATSYTGTKLSFSACSVGGTSSSVAAIGGLARSTANARTSGHVNAVNSGSVIFSMPANTGVPVNAATLTHLVCYS